MRLTFFFNLVLLFLSILTILKGFIVNKFYARYFIINNQKKLIDPRSSEYCSIRELKNSLNFVRSLNFKLSLIAFFKHKNIIFINSLEYFSLKLKSNNVILLEFIFKLFNIKSFLTIDDYRYFKIFIPVCKKLNIKSTGYMHGRISREISSQKYFFQYKFDRYYVWSKYFKLKILKINSNYKEKEIFIYNKFKSLKLSKKISNKKNIMFIQEEKVPNKLFFFTAKQILKNKNYKINYKFRQNNKIDKEIYLFCKNNGISVYHKISFENLISMKKIDAIIGTNSTALLNASYFNIFPICYKSKYSLKEFFDEEIVFQLNLNNKILPQIKYILKNKIKLKKIKNKIWK